MGCFVQVLDDVKDAPRITAAVAAPAEQPVASRDTEPKQSPTAEEGPAAMLSQTDGAAAEESEAAAEREAQLRDTPADVVASVNFSLCLLHTREDALRYLRLAHAAMQQQDGSIMVSRRSLLSLAQLAGTAARTQNQQRYQASGFCCECQVLDLLGGPSAECNARIDRSNTVTGASFLWEQDGFSPVSTSCQL